MNSESDALVVGATGLLGLEIARLLSESGQRVRAVVRPTAAEAKRQALEQLRVELSEGDLKHPASLARACEAARTVVCTASAMLSRQPGDSLESVDGEGLLELVATAKQAGVARFVFVSFAPSPVDSYLQRAKRAVEGALRESGMDFCILQPSYFTEVWWSPALGFDPGQGHARVFGAGTQRVSWVSYRDVARFAAAAVEYDRFSRVTLPIGGPDALSPLEVLSIFEELGAPHISLEHVPEEALEAQRRGASNALEEAFAALMLGLAHGQVIDVGPQQKLLTGRLLSVRDHARSMLRE